MILSIKISILNLKVCNDQVKYMHTQLLGHDSEKKYAVL